MAIITQAGVNKLTRGTRARFDLENEQERRRLALTRAARRAALSFDFDPKELEKMRRQTAVENAVGLARRAQQQQDITAEQQGVREKFANDPAYRGPTRLFDAPDLIDLPASIGRGGLRMAPSELVRTEKQRVEGGSRGGWHFEPATGQTKLNGWTAEDDFNAGAALRSRPMMKRAFDVMSGDARTAKAEGDAAAQAAKKARERFELARTRETLQVARRRGQIAFDPTLDPLKLDTPMAGRMPATKIPAPEFDSLTGALSVRRKLNEPAIKLRREEETRLQRAEDRDARISAAQKRAGDALAKEQGAALKAFDKSPEGTELATLRAAVARDEQLAGKKLGAFRAAFDFGRSTGDATPEAEAATRRLTQNRTRIQALEQRRAGLTQTENDRTASAAGGYASPYAKEIADLERQITGRKAGPDLDQAKRRRLQLQATELRDMLKRGAIDQEEAERRAAVLLRQ